MTEATEPLTDVLDELARTGRERAVSLGDVLDSFEHRSLGFLLTLLGLLAAMPVIGDIPGMSILLGTLILIVVGQHFLGKEGKLWMPERLRRQEIGRERFDKVMERSRPWTKRVDRLLKPRFTVIAAGRPNRILIAIATGLLALSFYPLAFVPFGVNAPAIGVMAFGLGLMASDGLLVGFGYALSGVTLYILLTVAP